MPTLYTVHDRFREKTYLYQYCELVEFFAEISHLIEYPALISDFLLQCREYEPLKIHTKDYNAGPRFFITRHFLEE